MFSGLTIHHWITSWDALPWGRLCLSPLLRTFSSLKFFMWGEASCTLPPSILSCHLSLSLFSPCLGSHADQLSFLGDFYGRGKLIFQSSGRRKLWLIISAHAIKVCTETRGRPCHFHGSEALGFLAWLSLVNNTHSLRIPSISPISCLFRQCSCCILTSSPAKIYMVSTEKRCGLRPGLFSSSC